RQPLRGDTAVLLELFAFSSLLVAFGLRNFQWRASFVRSVFFMVIQISVATGITISYRLSWLHPLHSFPGPWSYRISNLRIAQVITSGSRHATIQALHLKYGKFVRIGPNTLSINSRSAVAPIYASAKCLDRSTACHVPVLPGDGLFFVVDRDIHRTRPAIWAKTFTTANLDFFQPILNQRTEELAECMKRRTQPGRLDFSRCIEDWSYDFMGDFAFGPGSSLELMRNGDPDDLVKNGKTATALFDM
ncbi:hypothetical protein B0H10DRAFT_1797598, partial [Mycena sp. CBHHK59/15]